MANTYSQINIHCVFAVLGRENFLLPSFRDGVHRYIAGILRKDGIFPLAINGWTDHVHVLFELPPKRALSDQMRILKAGSSRWINENNFLKGTFNWQSGYSAFSCSKSHRDSVIKYIQEQELHHETKSFREEYLELLAQFEIPVEDQYIFEFYD